MRRTVVVSALALGLLVLLAVPALGLSSPADTHSQADADETVQESEVAPGERLSGALGVHEADLEGDLDQRTFGIQMARAASEDAQADVVEERLAAIEERLSELEERRAALEEKREAGEISEGQYRASVARLAAETGSAASLTERTERAAGELPHELLEERGIDTESIQTLKEKADELSGPEVAEIARSIAGHGVGDTPADNRSVGPPFQDDDETGLPHDDHPGQGNQSGSDDMPGQGAQPGDDDEPGQGATPDDDDGPGQGNPPGGDDHPGQGSQSDDEQVDDSDA